MSKTILTTVVVAVLATSAGSVLAAGDSAKPPLRNSIVRYGDLNLESPQGAHAMLSRIKSAARSVCEPKPDTLYGIDEWEACVSKATADAVANLNAPAVTTALNGASKGSVRLAQNSPR